MNKNKNVIQKVFTPMQKTVLALSTALAFTMASGLAVAQTFPNKPIRIVTGFPGGAVDTTARLVASGMSEVLGEPVIVETKPGASGMIASDYVAKAKGDGYTLLVATPSSVLVAPQTMKKSSFQPLTDLRGINRISRSPLSVALNPDLGVGQMKDLVALSKTRTVTLGTNGLGTSLHILVLKLNDIYDTEFRVVPYRSSSQSAVDAMAGHIDGAISDLSAFIPFHQDDKLRLVAVTSTERADVLPDVAAVSEDVPGFVMENWMALFAPDDTPEEIVNTLNNALLKVLEDEQVQAHFEKLWVTPAPMTSPADFQQFVNVEHDRFGEVIRENDLVKE